MSDISKIHQVACIRVHTPSDGYTHIMHHDPTTSELIGRAVVDGITEWSTVTHQEFVALRHHSTQRNSKFILVERFDSNGGNFIGSTVKQYLAFCKEQEDQIRQAQALAEQKRMQARLRKQARTEKQEKQLLEELLRKHGTESSGPR